MADALTGRFPRATTAVAVVVALVALSIPLAGAFRQAGAPMEEGKLLAGGELVLHGEVPHRDFEHFYGPADVWAVAAAFAITEPSVAAERALGLLYTVVLVLAVFAIARRAGGRVAAAAAAVMSGWILVPFGVHAYSWVGGLSLLTLAVAVALRAVDADGGPAQRWLPHLAGAIAGLSLLYRADLIVAAALVAAALWWRLDRSQRIAGALAALVTGGVPYLVHVVVAGFGNVWQGMVVDTLFRLRDGRALPMPPPSGALAGWLDRVAPEPPPSALLPDLDRVFQVRAFFWLTALAVVALVIVAAVAAAAARRRSDPRTTWLLCVAALSAGTVSQMLQRADATHVRFVACTAVPLAAVAVAVVWSMVDDRIPRAAVATEAVALTGLVLALAVPFYSVRLVIDSARRVTGSSDVVEVGRGSRTFPVAPDVAPQVVALLDAMDGVEGGRVFVGPRDLRLANYSDSFLYFVLGDRFRPAGFLLEANPGISNATGSGLADQLRAADVLVLTDAYDAWEEPNTSRRLGPVEPVEVRDREFCSYADVGRYQVLVARDRCQ